MAKKKITIDDFPDRWKNPFAQFYKNGNLSIALARFNGDIIDANPSFLNLFGFSEEELNSGQLNWKKFTPREFLATTEAIDNLKHDGNSPVYIKEYLHTNGTRVAVLITTSVIDHPEADVINCMMDLTDLQVLKDQLNLVAAKFGLIWNSGFIAINTWNVDGYILEANPAFTQMLGYTQEDIKSKKVKWKELHEPGYNKYIQDVQVIQSGLPVAPFETKFRHKEGTYRTVMIGFEMLPGSLTEGICIIIDVTEQKKLQERLEKTTERIRKITEHMVDVILIYDRDYRYLYVSPAIFNYFGRPASDYIGKICGQVGIPENISLLMRKAIDQVFTTKESVVIEYALHDQRYVQSLLTPEFDPDGNVETVMAVSRDITLLKQQEQKKDGFISMVGHELKTPVTSLKGIVQLAQRNIKAARHDDALRFLEKAEKILNKQASLIDHLMEVSRVDNGKIKLNYTTFSVYALLSDCMELIAVNHGAELIKLSCDHGMQLTADWNRLEQVLCNLLSNASRYSSPESAIAIEAETNDGYLTIAVKDHRIGIEQQKLPFIFERFYRINENGRHPAGLGLGLYISAQIVKMHKGQIWAESELGKGSVFYIRVPVSVNQPLNDIVE
jgi:two-component system CheB/CheR fusion protein